MPGLATCKPSALAIYPALKKTVKVKLDIDGKKYKARAKAYCQALGQTYRFIIASFCPASIFIVQKRRHWVQILQAGGISKDVISFLSGCLP